MSTKHEFFAYMDRVSDDIAESLNDIHKRFKKDEDSGTAGARGEKVWADLFEEWLPEDLKIETTAKILFPNGEASPQQDVILLEPNYPRGLLKKNAEYLFSEGVLAAFESRLTVRAADVLEAGKDAAWIKGQYTRHNLDPKIGPSCGLLGLTHEWKREPSADLSKNLRRTLSIPPRPTELMDVCCVVNLDCHVSSVMVCEAASPPGSVWVEADFNRSRFKPPVVGLIAYLWGRVGSSWLPRFVSRAEAHDRGSKGYAGGDRQPRFWSLEDAVDPRRAQHVQKTHKSGQDIASALACPATAYFPNKPEGAP